MAPADRSTKPKGRDELLTGHSPAVQSGVRERERMIRVAEAFRRRLASPAGATG